MRRVRSNLSPHDHHYLCSARAECGYPTLCLDLLVWSKKALFSHERSAHVVELWPYAPVIHIVRHWLLPFACEHVCSLILRLTSYRSLILEILSITLNACMVADYITTAQLNVSADLFFDIGKLLLLWLVAFPLRRHLFTDTSPNTNIGATPNAVMFALVTLLWLPQLVLSSYIELAPRGFYNSESYNTYRAIANASSKISAAYCFVYFVAALVASAYIGFGVKSSSANGLSPKTKGWTFFTITTLLVGTLSIVVRQFGWGIGMHRRINIAEYVVFTVLWLFSIPLPIFGALMTVKHSMALMADPEADRGVYSGEGDPVLRPVQAYEQH